MRFILAFSALVFLSLPVAAEQKYSAWSNPDGSGGTTKELVDKLNALIDEAEKSRAADPVFLRDLRALTSGFAVPENVAPKDVSVLSDDFSDGDFNTNPVWTVNEGRFWIEKDWGLRSAITPGDTTAPEPEKKASSKDLAIAIFGAVLKKATKSKSEPTQNTAAKPQVATIHSTAAIANAFTIVFELSSWQPQGRFDIGPFQGTDTGSGYRLSYAPGGSLAIHRVSSRGSSVVKQGASLVPLEDQKFHTIQWSRDSSARMTVSIDAKVVLSTTDRSFSDPFQGIVISNRGGDYIIKRIAVSSIN
ncbi:MAG: hypothetical protein H8E36_07365 [Rhodospirillaceae bacterium]|nr:hypothetical protein [Rhodospirillaceae bacterium]MBL6942654.1 hypothetical protein [Rhodospirillales bacterium]